MIFEQHLIGGEPWAGPFTPVVSVLWRKCMAAGTGREGERARLALEWGAEATCLLFVEVPKGARPRPRLCSRATELLALRL